jgi:choline dehydrogenase-like flavoprotein
VPGTAVACTGATRWSGPSLPEQRQLDNLYVADTSFFPSIGAVNPSLTVMANAIRVGEHLQEKMR